MLVEQYGLGLNQTFKGIIMYKYYAKTKRVIDGDTIDFEVDLGFHMKKTIRVRLSEIDTPELRGEEKELGQEVKQFVSAQLFTSHSNGDLDAIQVVVSTRKTGSFGRWLGEVIFPNGSTLADKIRAEFGDRL